MTIHIPKGVVAGMCAALVLGFAYVLYEEGPPLWRYLTKFEAM